MTRPSNKRSRAGSIAGGEDQRESQVPRIIWFKPTDKRVPLIAIPVEQAPIGFIENSDAFENLLFLVNEDQPYHKQSIHILKKYLNRARLNVGQSLHYIHLVYLKVN